MKIALTCPASLPATQFGGILFLCVDIAREISNEGHDVKIYTTDLDFANNPKTFNKNLPIIEKVERFEIIRSHVWFAVNLFFVNPNMYFQMLRDKPDVIHSVGARSFQALIAAIVAKKKKIPFVLSDQGGLTTHPDLVNSGSIKKFLYKLQMPLVRFVISQATKISVGNEYERDIFSKFCSRDKIVVIRNGINLDSLYATKMNFREKYNIKNDFLLFVGRFNKVKGIDILLNAINSIKDVVEMKDRILLIMGVDFGFEAEMFQMISQLELQDKVTVIKNPPREDVISAYKECKFLVLPSRWELSPLTPLEGFAFKKAVISTNTHGIPYTVKDRENGLLVKPEDYESLASAILELLRNEVKCNEYGLAGYNLVQNVCNSKTMAKNTLEIYRQIVNR
jgi:glycosyltransferase involved in cell wall biosynthesis